MNAFVALLKLAYGKLHCRLSLNRCVTGPIRYDTLNTELIPDSEYKEHHKCLDPILKVPNNKTQLKRQNRQEVSIREVQYTLGKGV